MKASSLLNSITVWILFWVYFNDRERVTGKFTANAENLKQENHVVALNRVSVERVSVKGRLSDQLKKGKMFIVYMSIVYARVCYEK